MKKVVLVVLNDFTHDNRVLKEATSLSNNGYDVSVCALHEKHLQVFEEIGKIKVFRLKLKSRNISKSKIVRAVKYFEFMFRFARKFKKTDIIHCNDWMTGLIPAMARQLGIPCLFTIHNIHTVKTILSYIEDRGIDAASFWQHLYYERMSYNYEETRDSNPVDFLASGVFAAHFVNTVSPTFLTEIVEGRHAFIEPPLQQELANKWWSECATGILNSPDPSFEPATDKDLACIYGPGDHVQGKLENKRFIQKSLGLI